LALISLKALLRDVTAMCSGFGLFFGVSFAGGHCVLLPTVVFAMHGEKETMSPKESNFKNFHGPSALPLCG
jgi:hypothetical protein